MRTAAIVVASVVVLLAAALARSEDGARELLPAFVMEELAAADFTPSAGDASAFSVPSSAAAQTVRASAFLGKGPDAEPTVVPALMSGPISRGPTTDEAEIRIALSVPFWVVYWRSVPADQVGRFWDPGGGDRVNAVFLVDGVTGDCCWLNRVSKAR